MKHENDRHQVEACSKAQTLLEASSDLLKTGAKLPNRHMVEKAMQLAHRAAREMEHLASLMIEIETG